MSIPDLKARFHQLCNLELPTAEDVGEVHRLGDELIALRQTAAEQVVMTEELILGRIQRLVMRREVNNMTQEENEASTQEGYALDLLCMPDDGTRH